MRFALPDIHRLYRNPSPARDARSPLRVSHALGVVWYAGTDRVLDPEPSRVDAPWCLFGVVPTHLTDGIEDRLIVCDATLARHALAWRVDAPANEDNVFLQVARSLELVARVDAILPGRTVLIAGHLHDPLARARLVARRVVIDGAQLANPKADAVLTRLGIDSG